jgi:hypothetical protein
LIFYDEFQLTSGSLRIDSLVIKSRSEIVIDKNIARDFREFNILEYKSPSDSLDIHDYNKVHGYKFIYASQNNIADTDKVTVTMVTSRYPHKLLKYLSNRRNITSNHKGIYVVNHDIGLTQIVVSSELPEDENLWLTHLKNKLTDNKLLKVLSETKKREKSNAIENYLEVVVNANQKSFQELVMGKKIDKILNEIGYIDKWRAEGKAEARVEAKVEARVEMIVDILSRRLESPPKTLQKKISSVQNMTKLEELTDCAWTCTSLDDFVTALK